MGCSRKNDKKDKMKAGNVPSNDQLGENASEEFASESYTNAGKIPKKK
jgi:hypothetical protein